MNRRAAVTAANAEGPWNPGFGGLYIYDPSTEKMSDITPKDNPIADVVVHPDDPNKMVSCTINRWEQQANGAYGDDFYFTVCDSARQPYSISIQPQTYVPVKTLTAKNGELVTLSALGMTIVNPDPSREIHTDEVLVNAKDGSMANRRLVFSYLQSKEAIKELFGDVATKIADRPGGYTRILKTGNRLGDNAKTCFIELVDYNEAMLKDKGGKAVKKTRRSRRKAAAPAAEAPAAEAPAAETPAAE